MFLQLVSILTVATIASDILFYRLYWRKHTQQASMRGGFMLWAAFTDAIPVTIAATSLIMRDNTEGFMVFAMWGFYIWMLTVIPRMIYYLFVVVRLPRIGVGVGAAFAITLIWGATYGRTTLRINRVEICSERIPQTFAGMRIVQFSDLHAGSIVRPEKELRQLVDSINSLQPDLIVFCGDLVTIRHTELTPSMMQILSGLKATYGVVSVTGNHDVGTYVKNTDAMPEEENRLRLAQQESEMGWLLLEDSTLYIRRGSDSISVTGIAFDPALKFMRHAEELPVPDLKRIYRGIPDSLFNITVAHLPQLWDHIRSAGRGDLTLSGHVHSLQIKVRLFGREWSPARWLYDRWSGRYDEGRSTLYINDGTGYVIYPMRLGAYPEITLFTLQPCE